MQWRPLAHLRGSITVEQVRVAPYCAVRSGGTQWPEVLTRPRRCVLPIRTQN